MRLLDLARAELLVFDYAVLSCIYAKDILGSRFYEGEPIIAMDGKVSLYYAKYIVKGRFELGEEAIFMDDNLHKEYTILIANLN